MRRVSVWLPLLLVVVVPGRGRGAPEGECSDAVLAVIGNVPRTISLTAEDLARLPRRTVKVKDQSGAETEYQGTLVADVLKQAGVKFGEALRGPALADYLVVEAADKYRAVFALPELDPAFTDAVVLLADRRDGKPLAPTEGPYRIVIPAERRHSRWVRQVVTLRIGKA